MIRSRRASGLLDSLSFGGRIPALLGALLLLTATMSIGAVFFPPVAVWTALVAGSLAKGQAWRLVSWPFVQEDPMSLVFGGLALFFFVPALAREEGESRLAGRLLGITIATALTTHLVGWLLGVSFAYLGIWPIVDVVVILWALSHPDDRVLLYFALPVSGMVLAWITLGTNALFVIWAIGRGGLAGLVGMMPLIAATAIAWGVARGRLGAPRRWRLAWRDWWLERQLKRRSRRLRVVGKGDQRGPHQWMN